MLTPNCMSFGAYGTMQCNCRVLFVQFVCLINDIAKAYNQVVLAGESQDKSPDIHFGLFDYLLELNLRWELHGNHYSELTTDA